MNQNESENKQLCLNWDTIAPYVQSNRQNTTKSITKDMASDKDNTNFFLLLYQTICFGIQISQTCPLLYVAIYWMNGKKNYRSLQFRVVFTFLTANIFSKTTRTKWTAYMFRLDKEDGHRTKNTKNWPMQGQYVTPHHSQNFPVFCF
jgi:hypothetical protein